MTVEEEAEIWVATTYMPIAIATAKACGLTVKKSDLDLLTCILEPVVQQIKYSE